MKAEDLSNLGQNTRDLIENYLKGKSKRERNAFAQRCGIQPVNLEKFLKGDKGLNQYTFENIGKIISMGL